MAMRVLAVTALPPAAPDSRALTVLEWELFDFSCVPPFSHTDYGIRFH
jgi:hypothetical protein